VLRELTSIIINYQKLL